MNLLYWNLKNHNIDYLISRCLIENNIDFAIFSEFNEKLLTDVISLVGNSYRIVMGNFGCKRVKALIKISIKCDVLRENARFVIYQITFNEKTYIVCGVHLQDRRNSTSNSRKDTIRNIISYIESEERETNCDNTIIIGDLNSNPYDTEIIGFDGFNAVLFKDIIFQNEYRIHEEKRLRRFYNPILNYISEENNMYGSFYDSSHDDTPVWHCLDQALFRKSLANSIIEIEYLRKIESKSLMNRVKPNSMISDHLPLYVRID